MKTIGKFLLLALTLSIFSQDAFCAGRKKKTLRVQPATEATASDDEASGSGSSDSANSDSANDAAAGVTTTSKITRIAYWSSHLIAVALAVAYLPTWSAVVLGGGWILVRNASTGTKILVRTVLLGTAIALLSVKYPHIFDRLPEPIRLVVNAGAEVLNEYGQAVCGTVWDWTTWAAGGLWDATKYTAQAIGQKIINPPLRPEQCASGTASFFDKIRQVTWPDACSSLGGGGGGCSWRNLWCL